MYVRLLRFIDSRTKRDNEERLDFAHVTPVRRTFRIFPVRYFDMKNRWTRRWVELYLYGLSNLAQMAEANTYPNDWHEVSAKEMKKPFQEAYRLMVVELFNADLEASKDPKYLLTQTDFDNYNPSASIPVYEYLEHPYTAFFTEDRLRPASTPRVPVGEGITTEGGDTISPGEAAEKAVNPVVM